MANVETAHTFGGLLKKIRLEEAKIGLRAFAELIDWHPSNLSNLERGRTRPPADPQTIRYICDALGLTEDDPRRTEFFDLAARNGVAGDVAEAIREQPGIPVLVRAVANRRLDDDRLRELAEHIKKYY
ncbi:helix-turn-helix domain-containing protein [Anaerobaca lacustris]|uniref:Helix-turn-helix transcriptional regulator n=1 Tax=Anaerobaca lacustris TaxID=3044600 RepID=A0AAW6TZM1_9BACT|nr:helix-turn-helix transcriptional regulator [Sedimentisphaerales bacterium M17dextr]